MKKFMKRIIAILMATAFLVLVGCQNMPNNESNTDLEISKDIEVYDDAGVKRIKFEMPIKLIDDSEVEYKLKIDAKISGEGYERAPSYLCLPAKFDNAAKCASLFLNDENIKRVENRDIGGIKWPYKTDKPWLEDFIHLDNATGHLDGNISFEHGLGTIIASKNKGLDKIPDEDTNLIWKTGDKDGDGRAEGMRNSLEDCLELANDFIEAAGLDMLLVRTDVLDLTPFKAYRFYFGRNYNGIPSSVGVNSATTEFSWGQSIGEYMQIVVGDGGILEIRSMIYQTIETQNEEQLISAEEAVARLNEAAKVGIARIEDNIAIEDYIIDNISLVYLPQTVSGDGIDVIGDERGGGLMREMIPAWQFSTGYFSGRWSALEFYIDAVTGAYLP